MHCAISSQRKERHDSSIFIMSIWLSVSLITHFCISGLGVFYVFRRCYNGTMEQQVGSTNSWMCNTCESGSRGVKRSTTSSSTRPGWQLRTGHVIFIYRILFSCSLRKKSDPGCLIFFRHPLVWSTASHDPDDIRYLSEQMIKLFVSVGIIVVCCTLKSPVFAMSEAPVDHRKQCRRLPGQH